MNVSIIGRKVKITPDVRSYIEKKMKKIDHYVDYIMDFKIIIEKERHIYNAEVNIKVKGKIIHIFAKTPDIHSVIDTLFDKIDVKLRRYKDRIVNRRFTSSREELVEKKESMMAEETT